MVFDRARDLLSIPRIRSMGESERGVSIKVQRTVYKRRSEKKEPKGVFT